MKIIKCPLCGTDKHIYVCEKNISGNAFTIVKCSECNFYYTNPEPSQEELLDFYNSQYLELHENVWHDYEDSLNHHIRSILKNYGSKLNLDIGSAQGRFVWMVKSTGIESFGVEPNKESCQEAFKKYGVKLYNSTALGFLQNSQQEYDSITILNVLEHLPDPNEIIKLSRKSLIDNGKLLIVVPNVDFTLLIGFFRGLFGFPDKYLLNSIKFKQQGFDPPIHLSAFTKSSLVRLLRQNNYRIIKATNPPTIKTNSRLINVIKKLIYLLGKSLELLTLNRVVWGYSLLILAEKENVH